MVTLPHPIYNSLVAEVVRWNDVIISVNLKAKQLQVG